MRPRHRLRRLYRGNLVEYRICRRVIAGSDAECALLLKEQMKLLRGIYINNDIYYIYIHIIYIFIIRDKDN